MSSFKDTQMSLGEPGPFGMSAFGMNVIILSMRNALWVHPERSAAVILSMFAMFGGFGQILAGLLCWIKGRTFPATVFMTYGCFVNTYVAINLLPTLGLTPQNDPLSIAAYLFVWAIYTFFIVIGNYQHREPLVLQCLAGMLMPSLFLLAGSNMLAASGDLTSSLLLQKIAGYLGLVAGSCATYMGQAELNGWWVGAFPLRAPWCSSSERCSAAKAMLMGEPGVPSRAHEHLRVSVVTTQPSLSLPRERSLTPSTTTGPSCSLLMASATTSKTLPRGASMPAGQAPAPSSVLMSAIDCTAAASGTADDKRQTSEQSINLTFHVV